MALAGLGGAAVRGHLPALTSLAAGRAGLCLVAAADPRPDRRAASAPALRGLPLFDSTEAMLDRVRADVLVVATEPPAHASLIACAAERGLHVLCEKPLTVTREGHAVAAAAFADISGPALVTVNQYRYARTWRRVSRWTTTAARLDVPFTLDVRIERSGTDGHAASAWRDDVTVSGGALADHGAHFLALAWAISADVEVLEGRRVQHVLGELAEASLRIGSGRMAIRLSTIADVRHTGVELRLPGAALRWHDDAVAVVLGGREVRRSSTEALSDRRHVDALYVPMYRDLAGGLGRAAWRRRRTADTLAVGRSLVELLDRAEGRAAPLVAADGRSGQP